MTWEPDHMMQRCLDYGVSVWNTPGVTRHERVYATGVVVAGLIAAAAATAGEARRRILRTLNMLPYPRPLSPDNDLGELRYGLSKGLELMGVSRIERIEDE